MPTDDAKQEKFMDGLSEELQDKLSVVNFLDFQTLVDKAIVVEHMGRALGESCKRKWEAKKISKGQLSSSSRRASTSAPSLGSTTTEATGVCTTPTASRVATTCTCETAS